jgi:ubiquitin carboxyl-terminal hydrolase 4/11/15
LSSVNSNEYRREEESSHDSSSITIQDCFEEFRKKELLDEDNKWYCNKCKDFVQATKQMELFKAPPIMIINIKRFKTGKNSMRYSMWGSGGGEKIDS